MTEIIFEVREAEEGGFWARALGHSIFTQGEDWDELRVMVLKFEQVLQELGIARHRIRTDYFPGFA